MFVVFKARTDTHVRHVGPQYSTNIHHILSEHYVYIHKKYGMKNMYLYTETFSAGNKCHRVADSATFLCQINRMF